MILWVSFVEKLVNNLSIDVQIEGSGGFTKIDRSYVGRSSVHIEMHPNQHFVTTPMFSTLLLRVLLERCDQLQLDHEVGLSPCRWELPFPAMTMMVPWWILPTPIFRRLARPVLSTAKPVFLGLHETSLNRLRGIWPTLYSSPGARLLASRPVVFNRPPETFFNRLRAIWSTYMVGQTQDSLPHDLRSSVHDMCHESTMNWSICKGDATSACPWGRREIQPTQLSPIVARAGARVISKAAKVYTDLVTVISGVYKLSPEDPFELESLIEHTLEFPPMSGLQDIYIYYGALSSTPQPG